MNEADLHREIARVQAETGLPTTDVIRFGADSLLNAIEGLRKTISDKM